MYPNYPAPDQPYYGEQHHGYPHTQPISHAGVGAYAPAQPPPVPPLPPRRSGATITAAVLGAALVVTLIGAIILYVGETNSAEQATERADALQVQVDAARKSKEDLAERFRAEKFEERYLKVKDADAAEARAWRAFGAASADDKAAFNAWINSVQACMREVTAYNTTAAGYPKELFTASAPATVDLNADDTDCLSLG